MCIDIFLYVYMYIYVYTYVCIYMCTYVHVHIYTAQELYFKKTTLLKREILKNNIYTHKYSWKGAWIFW